MALKTASDRSDATYQGLASEFYYRQPWETSWIQYRGVISGKIVRRVNASPSLEFSYMNPRGGNTELFAVGGHVKLCLDWTVTDSTMPQFQGFITPGAGIGKSGNSISLHAVGYSSRLGQRFMFLGDYESGWPAVAHRTSYDGWEASTVIRDIILELEDAPMYADRVVSSWPQKYVGEDIILPEGWTLKSEIVQTVVEGMLDAELSPITPRPYYWWETPRKSSNQTDFVVRKFPDLSTASAVRTLTWDDEIIRSADNVRVDQCTRCFAQSKTNRKMHEVYESESAVARYGYLDAPIEVDSESRDDLLWAAFRSVQSHRYPFRSIKVDLARGIDIEPLEVLQIENGPYGFEGKQAVVEVSIPFGTEPQLMEVTLASQEEVVTDML